MSRTDHREVRNLRAGSKTGNSSGSIQRSSSQASISRTLRGELSSREVKKVEPLRMKKVMKKEVKSLVGVKAAPCGDEGKRAQKGSFMLEVNSISGAQEAQYQHYLRCFKVLQGEQDRISKRRHWTQCWQTISMCSSSTARPLQRGRKHSPVWSSSITR